MARTPLTATQTVAPASGCLNLTGLFAPAGAATGFSFANSGREVLYVQVGTVTTGGTVQIPNYLGQAVTGYTVAMGTSSVNMVGPFPAALDQAGSQTVYVDITQSTDVSVALVQQVGLV